MSDQQDPNRPPSSWPSPSFGGPPPPPSGPPAPGGYMPYPLMAPVNPFDGRATPVLIFGILGLVFCQLLAPVAWVMGHGVKRDAEASGWAEPGLSKAGRICGIVGSVLMIVVIAGAAIAIAARSTASTY